VVEVAVGFDHEPALGPEEVDQVRPDSDVHLGRRQPVAATEAQEVSLEVAAGAVAAVGLLDRQSENVRLADRPAELIRGNRTGPA
jgi:hypothetical protein